MMSMAEAEDLFPEVRNPEGTQIINERCTIKTQDGYRVVLVSGIVLASYAVTDRMAEAHAMVSLVEQGWASQQQVAIAFECSPRTIRRDQRRFENGGLAALGHGGGYHQRTVASSGRTQPMDSSPENRRPRQSGNRPARRSQRDGHSQTVASSGLEGCSKAAGFDPGPNHHACEPKPVRFWRCRQGIGHRP